MPQYNRQESLIAKIQPSAVLNSIGGGAVRKPRNPTTSLSNILGPIDADSDDDELQGGMQPTGRPKLNLNTSTIPMADLFGAAPTLGRRQSSRIQNIKNRGKNSSWQ